jgi:hypothetical protein
MELEHPSITLITSAHSKGQGADMNLSFFQKARDIFDFSEDQAVARLPKQLQDIVTLADMDSLTPVISALTCDIDPAWDVALCDIQNYGYDIDVDQKIVSLDSKGLGAHAALSSPYFKAQIFLSLLEGLRMIRHIEWLDNDLERYHPESVIKIGRFCVADSVTQTIYGAWHARESGQDSLWKHLLCGKHSDMTQCFDRVMERCLTQGNDESDAMCEALSLTFRTWFTDAERVRLCDHDSLNILDSMMEDGIKIGRKHIDHAAITCLTYYVGGQTSYLAMETVRDILINPFYGEMDDAFNKAHLTQIIRDNTINEVAGIPFQDVTLAQRFMA